MAQQLNPPRRVYHKDDPRGPRGEVHEVRGDRSYVFWPDRAAEWIRNEFLKEDRS